MVKKLTLLLLVYLPVVPVSHAMDKTDCIHSLVRNLGPVLPGISGAVATVNAEIQLLAPTRYPVLIQGENGTGKEIVASALTLLSQRKEKPFVVVHMGAIPEGLIEGKLFGWEKGAFTGAVNQGHGAFGMAAGGTLFLDELGELPLTLQAKLLRVLDGYPYEPVGSQRSIKPDVRVIAATNRDLGKEVREGRFREDLYFRISGHRISIPPLRNRQEDIPFLAEMFRLRAIEDIGKPQGVALGFSPEAVDSLLSLPLPGNVRELRSIVESAVLHCQAESISSELIRGISPGYGALEVRETPDLIQSMTRLLASPLPELLWLQVESSLKSHVYTTVLEREKGNQSRAAKALGLNRNTLRIWMRANGLLSPVEEVQVPSE